MKEPPDTNIQVVYHDSDTNTEYVSAAYSSPSLRGITHDDVQTERERERCKRRSRLHGPFFAHIPTHPEQERERET